MLRTTILKLNKHLTKAKRREIRELTAEYSRVCNFILNLYGDYINTMLSVEDALLTNNIRVVSMLTKTFLTHKIVKQAFKDVYSTVREKGDYKKVKYTPSSISLPYGSQTSGDAEHIKFFDYVITLNDFRKDKGDNYKVAIPVNKHSHFRGLMESKVPCTKVTLTDREAIFTFCDKSDKDATEASLRAREQLAKLRALKGRSRTRTVSIFSKSRSQLATLRKLMKKRRSRSNSGVTASTESTMKPNLLALS